MPSQYLSPDFKLYSVEYPRVGVVRVRFTFDPKKRDSTDPTDALYPQNYTLSGIHPVIAGSVAPVSSDPQAVDVYINAPLATGLWTLSVASGITSNDNDALQGPYSLTFSVTEYPTRLPPNGGAVQDEASDIFRKHLPAVFQGPGWEALTSAVSIGDTRLREQARAAFDQLFVSSASGTYLDARAGDFGVLRPPDVGMSDNSFRRLTTKLTASKVTQQSVLEALEVFYGAESVSAYVDAKAEPYDLEHGWTLTISDDRQDVQVVFDEEEFGQIGDATAVEVALAITRACERVGSHIYAVATTDPLSARQRVRVFSGAKGLSSRLIVKGGLAWNALMFDGQLDLGLNIGDHWSVTEPRAGVARFVLDNPDPLLLGLQEGDCVNISCTGFHENNRGSFTVTDVYVRRNGSQWDQWFEVGNELVVAQGGPVPTVDDFDIVAFRPTRRLPQSGLGAPLVVAQSRATGFKVVLPTTTRVVNRREGTGAYLQPRTVVPNVQITTLADGTAIFESASPHGLSEGGQILVESAAASDAMPATVQGVDGTAGQTGTTDVNQLSLLSQIRSDVPDILSNSAAAVLDDDSVLIVGGWNPQTNAYLTSCYRWAITAASELTSGAARGREQYAYNWYSATALSTASARHTLTALSGSFSGFALKLGGVNSGGALSTALLYDRITNVWTAVPNGVLTARYGHLAIAVKDFNGNDVVAIVGGLSNSSTAVATIQKFTSASNGTISGVFATEARGRFNSAGAAVDENTWIAAGGAYFDGAAVEPRADSICYDEATSTYVPVGPMIYARMDHAAIALGDGQVMVVGGYGRNRARELDERVLSECEIFSKRTGAWRAAGKMRNTRRWPNVFRIGNEVYAVGGIDHLGEVVTQNEVYNINTGKWTTLPDTCSQQIMPRGVFAQNSVGTLFLGGDLVEEPPSLSSIILSDPDLFIYYPLDDATQPATVADLGPGGYDLTVYDTDDVFTFGAAGPNAETPVWCTADFDVSDSSYENYLARDEDFGPIHPSGNVTVGWIMQGQGAYSTNLAPWQLYGYSGGAGGAVTGNSVLIATSTGLLEWYIGNQTLQFTSVPSPTTTAIFALVLDLSVGTYGTAYLYINGTLHQSIALAGVYVEPSPTRTLGVLLYSSATLLYKSPPSITNYATNLDGGLAHWFLSARAWEASEILTLAQTAGLA